MLSLGRVSGYHFKSLLLRIRSVNFILKYVIIQSFHTLMSCVTSIVINDCHYSTSLNELSCLVDLVTHQEFQRCSVLS